MTFSSNKIPSGSGTQKPGRIRPGFSYCLRIILLVGFPFHPVLPAQRNVAFIAAQHDLLALPDDLAVRQPGVAGRFFAAPADRLDLLDGVRPGQQPVAALEKIFLEIRPQPVIFF